VQWKSDGRTASLTKRKIDENEQKNKRTNMMTNPV